MSKTIEFLYRDGANYKWYYHAKLSDERIKSLEEDYGKLEEGMEICYDTDLGLTQDEFHKKRGYEYDDEIDHNILEVVAILSEKEAENQPITFYID